MTTFTVNEDQLTTINLGTYGLDSQGWSSTDSVSVVISVSSGTLTYGDATSSTLTITGTLSDVQSILSTDISYQGDSNVNGTSAATLTIDAENTTTAETVDLTPTPTQIDITPVEDEATGSVALVGTGEYGGVIGVDTDTVSDVDGSVTFTYQWQSKDVFASFENIDSATASTLTVSSDLMDQDIRVVVTATDSEGGETVFTSDSVTGTDTVAPEEPVITSAIYSNDATPTISGTAEANITVYVRVDGGSPQPTTSSSDGNWSLSLSGALSEGSYSITTEGIDDFGNSSGQSAPFTLTIDTTAPTISSASFDFGSALNAAEDDSDGVLSVVTSGAEDDQVVTLTIDGNDYTGSVSSDAASITVSASALQALSEGTQAFTVNVSDLAGNAATEFSSSFSVDTVAPTISSASFDFGSALNAAEDDSDGVLSVVTSGAEDDQVVTLTIDGNDYTGSVSSNAASITVSASALQALSEGTQAFTVNVSDLAGNAATEFSSSFSVDTVAPDAPSVDALGLTNDNTPAISGTAEANSTVEVFEGSNSLGTTTADGSGDWSLTPTTLSDGSYTITATSTDAAGNLSSSSSSVSLTVDATAPTISSASFDFGSALNAAEDDSGGVLSVVTSGAEDDQVVTLTIDGNDYTGSVSSNAASITVSASALQALSEGTQAFTVNVSDLAGNAATEFSSSFSVDTVAPDAPSVDALGLTNDNTPAISGTAEANSTVEVFEGSNSLGTTTADGSGDWSLTPTTLSDGSYTITATSTDAAGNLSSSSSSVSLTVDASAPSAPSVDALGLTNDNTPAISGTAEANSTIEVFEGSNSLGTTTADGSGDWSLTPTTLSDGSYTITATSTDAAGNVSSASSSESLTVDATSPSAPSVDALGLTNDNTPAITGTAEANSTVEVFEGSNSLGTTTADGSGDWSLTPSTLSDGSYTITATSTDAAGNLSSSSSSESLTVDTTSPSSPSVDALGLTNDNTPAISGTAEANSTVEVFEGSNSLGTTTADGSGDWSLTPTTLSDGSYTITATSTDAAGNESSASSGEALEVDTAAPTVSSIAISKVDGLGGNLAIGDTVTVAVTMNGAVTVSTSNGTPTLELNIGGTSKSAAYASGSGSSTLLFSYTIESNLSDADGISIDQDSLALNGGTINDAAGNASDLSHSAVSDNAAYLVATVADTAATDLSYPGTTSGEVRSEGAFAAILSDGSVVAWGDSSNGGDITGVSGLDSNVVAIYSTSRAFAALKSDGSVVTWGNSLFGGDSSSESGSLAGGTLSSGVSQVFSSGTHFVALKDDGSVVTWGYDLGGLYTAPTDLTDVVSIASNESSFAAIKTDGSVVAWGVSFNGGDTGAASSSLDGTVSATSIASTSSAFAAIMEDGSVVTWGGDGGDSSGVANDLDGSNDVVALYASSRAFTAVHADGTVTSWGESGYGADSSSVDFNGTNDDLSVTGVYSTDSAFAALLSDGSVVTWGDSSNGGTIGSSITGVQAVAATNSAFAALKSDGSVVAWGAAGGTITGSDLDNDVVSLHANNGAFAAIKSDGSVVTWGDSSYGGDTSDVSLAALLDGDAGEEIMSISSSDNGFSALRADGSIVTWGGSVSDGLVTSDSTAVSTAVVLADISDKEAVATLSVGSNTGTIEEGALLSADLGAVTDADGATTVSYQWQVSSDGISWSDDGGETSSSYQVASDESQVGQYIRVVVSTVDALGGTSTITSAGAQIANVNDAPTVTGANITDTATESGVDASGNVVTGSVASDVADSLFVNASDSDNVTDDFLVSRAKETSGAFANIASDTNVSGLYGTLTLSADGSYSYAINDANGDVQALDEDESLSETFIIEISDGSGGTVEQTLLITIDGTNDAPTVTGADIADTATEAGVDSDGSSVSGSVASGTADALFANASDVDDSVDDFVVAQAKLDGGTYASVSGDTDIDGDYGTLTLNSDGSYSYAIDDSNASVQALDETQSLSETFIVEISDGAGGTVEQSLVITVDGTNDAPTVSGTSITNNATEAGVASDGATISGTDATGSSGALFAQASDLDDDSSSFSVSQAKFTSGSYESVSSNTEIDGSYGTLSVNSDGSYSYAIDDSNGTVQALDVGEELTETFIIEISDGSGGTVEQTLEITIDGTDDAPVVTSTTASEMDEAGLDSNGDAVTGPSSSTVTVSITDVDDGAAAVFTQSGWVNVNAGSSFTQEGLYGSAEIPSDATGSSFDVVYTLDNTNETVQALAPGDVLTDVISVPVGVSGEVVVTHEITFTINGTNDAPVLNGMYFPDSEYTAIDEDASTYSESANILDGTFTDVDNDVGDIFVSGISVTGGASGTVGQALEGSYGSVTVSADGSWTYTTNDNADALDVDDEVSDSFTYTISDGAGGEDTGSFDILISGSNDGPTLTTGAVDPSLSEDGDASSQSFIDTGTITFADLDDTVLITAGSPTITPSEGVSVPSEISTILSSAFTVTDNSDNTASWSISASNMDLDFLGAGETVTIDLIVTATDDQSASVEDTISFVITGTNDAPTVAMSGNTSTASIAELADASSQTLSASGSINFDDLDANDDLTITTTSIVVSSVGASVSSELEADLIAAVSVSESLDSDGQADWSLSTAGLDLDYLDTGESIAVTIAITATDLSNESVTTNAVVTITGTNDGPTLSVEAVDPTVDEAVDASNQSLSDSGTIYFSDLDDNATITAAAAVVAGSEGVTIPSGLESSLETAISVTDNGNNTASWQLDDSGLDLDFLASTDTITVSVLVTATDDDAATATDTILLTIQGTNDAPTITVDTIANTATEAGVDGSGETVDTANATGISDSLFANASDVDTATADFFVSKAALSGFTLVEVTENSTASSGGSQVVGDYGTLTVGSDGSYSYAIDNNNADIQALDENSSESESFNIEISDGAGGSVVETLVITINGTNDAPTVSGATVADEAVEAGIDSSGDAVAGSAATGDADALFANTSDVDDVLTFVVSKVALTGETLVAVTSNSRASTNGSSVSGDYGTLVVGSDGSYSYVADDTNAVIQALDENASETESFSIEISDGSGGTVVETLVITINGTNDAPTVSGVTITNTAEEAGVDSSGNAVSGSAASGSTSALMAEVSDVDDDSFTVSRAKETSGAFANIASDTNVSGLYGTLTLSADGSYSYAINDANGDVQALDEDESLSETFIIEISDGSGGTVEQTLLITIDGTNDAPTVTGADIADTATEAGVDSDGSSVSGSVASGTADALFANASDVDDSVDDFVVAQAKLDGGTYASVSGDTDIDGDYGTLTLNSDGSYSYAIDDSNASVQALDETQSLSETFIVEISDGAGGTVEQSLVITVDGTNDAPVVTGADITNAAVEAGVDSDGSTNLGSTASGAADALFAKASDVDDSQATLFVSQAKLDGGTYASVSSDTEVDGDYGTLTLSDDGSYDYAIDDSNGSVQALNAGESLTETFTIEISDGSGGTVEQSLVITVTGTNDAPTVTSDTITGAATEAGIDGDGNGLASVDASGAADALFANISDVDNDTADFIVSRAGTDELSLGSVASNSTSSADGLVVTGSYGQVTIGADGSYSYVVDNTVEAVQALDVGDTIDESFSIEVSDDLGGTVVETLVVTITGTNDAPVASADTASVDEDATLSVDAASGVLANDVDDDASSSLLVSELAAGDTATMTTTAGTSVDGTYGTLTLAADGSYEYVADKLAADQLVADQTEDDVFTYTVSDGLGGYDTHTLTITVTGTNDSPELSIGESGVNHAATFVELAGTDDGSNAVNLVSSGVEIIDVDSLTLAKLDIAVSTSDLEAGDQLIVAGTTVALYDLTTGAIGDVTVGETMYAVEATVESGTATISFTSQDELGSSAEAAIKANYEALLQDITFNNNSDDFVNGSTREFSLNVVDELGDASNSATFTVSMDATNDTLSGTPAITGVLSQGETLSADVSGLSDADGLDSDTFAYQWYRSSDNGSTWTTISGATSSSFTLTRAEGLNVMKVDVTHTDLGGTTETVTSATSSPVAFSSVVGVVYDWYAHTALHDVSVAQGDQTDTTDSDGVFEIDKVANDGYTISLDESVTGDGVSLDDAILAYKMAYGAITENEDGTQINAYQYYAADIDQDGDVELDDAMDIFEMALDRSGAPAAEWLFIDEQMDFWDEATSTWDTTRDSIDWTKVGVFEDGDSGTANLVAVQKGDVDGSFSADSAYDDGNSAVILSQLQELYNAQLPNGGSDDDWWTV